MDDIKHDRDPRFFGSRELTLVAGWEHGVPEGDVDRSRHTFESLDAFVEGCRNQTMWSYRNH